MTIPALNAASVDTSKITQILTSIPKPKHVTSSKKFHFPKTSLMKTFSSKNGMNGNKKLAILSNLKSSS